ncbi:universal stress protein [Pedobacter foliorum]|uniref:universal stress protein n=1 Tax=Pedobacter foliorum TaxID=2739058 RepID=UPI0015653BD2|nr:universal stress protein [Pedobacter foliorum]NRF37690.1 universal stress protein [Pedobacter foliorum]
MKKILVPTDFSSSAKNAANYAMHLAKQIKANVKLCNAVMVPLDVPLAAHVAAPIVSFETLEYEVEQELKRWAGRLKEKDELETAPDTFHPLVEHVVGVGSVPDVITNVAANREVSLTVMGMSGAGGLSKFLLGSSSRGMVEATETPLLLVPDESRFMGLHKIAFATDLSKTDIAIVHILAGFARVFNAEILIVHISEKARDNEYNNQHKIDVFLNEVTNKVNYHKIYYQHVMDTAVGDGLDWLAEYGQIQMLAMVHRKHNVLHKLFKGSYTQKLKKRITIPLLVFPPDCGNRTL